MKEITKRILTAIIGIPAGILLIWLGGIYFLSLIIIISSLGIWELHKMYDGKNNSFYLTFVFNIVLLLTAFLNIEFAKFYFMIPSLLFLYFLISSVFAMLSKEKNTMNILSGNIFATLYISFSFIAVLFIREYIDGGFHLFLTILISIWVCDTFAYFTGKSIGKNKLWERISPKKTWEGAVGGYIGAVGSVFLLNYLFSIDLSISGQIIIGSITGVAGQFGDLFESKLKRDAGVKDSSNIIPGHGGVLDRFDSLIFVAPIIIFYFLIM